MMNASVYPFPAVVEQETAKKALLIALVNPKAGGLLIGGRKGTAKSVLARSLADFLKDRKLITLPLNVTEDMLFGSLDLEYAVSEGKRKFSSGILERANDNILYIDEANLLRLELLIAVLDANGSGFNQVERDGISHMHEVHTTVIATMNPEEGTLPGHVLDRFGMYVDMQPIEEASGRVKIIKNALEFAADPRIFREKYSEELQSLQEKISQAQEILKQIELSEAMLVLAATMCTKAFCAGHRAEIYLLEAAKALAALEERNYVLPKDVEEAACFVLPHRMRKPPEPEESQEEGEQDADDNIEDEAEDSSDNEEESQQPPPPPEFANNDREHDENNEQQEDKEDDSDKQDENINPQRLAPEEEIFEIDKHFKLPKLFIDLGNDHKMRKGSGKRSVTKTDLKQGRYVRAELPAQDVTDLAFDATIRAAAPYQKLRDKNNCALNIQKEDLRQKVREKRIGNTFLFAVDASGSMGARERMKAVKGAIFYMLQEAYEKRDRVGMLAFRKDTAEMLLPISRSVDLAQKCLAKLPTGGRTPLAEALSLALTILATNFKKDEDMVPIFILVTDGRANSSGEKEPVESAMRLAEKFKKANITSVVIDTEQNFIKLGIAKKIARAMGANYYTLQKLSEENVLRIVRSIRTEVF